MMMDFEWLFLGIFLVFLFKIAQELIRSLSYIRKLDKIPKLPKSLPLIGHGHHFIGLDNQGIYDKLLHFISENQTPFCLSCGPKILKFNNVIVLDEPDDLKIVLTSPDCLEKPIFYRFFGYDKGLTPSPLEYWKPVRKNLNPIFFHSVQLNQFIPNFNQRSADLIESLSRRVDGPTFDLGEYVKIYTIKMIIANLGAHCDFPEDFIRRYVHIAAELFDLVANRFFKPQLYLDCIYQRTELYQKEKKMRDDLENLVREKIDETRQYKTPEPSQRYTNFAQKMFSLEEEMEMVDSQALLDIAVLFLAAGMETSATTVSFALLMLAMNPEIQEKVVDEIELVVGDQVYLTEDIYPNLTYMEKVLKETLRLFPIIPYIARKASVDVQLAKYIVPKGTTMLIMLSTLQRKKKLWGPDANEFRPDRFDDPIISCSFLPFSYGARNCIGMKYAWLAMKTLMVYLLRNYKFETDYKYSNIKLKAGISLQSAENFPVRIRRRK